VEAERNYNSQAFRFLPIDEATELPLDFQSFSFWLGFWPQKPQSDKPANAPHSDLENCVANVVARYLGREVLTTLKQAALNAGVGLSVLLGGFFLNHAGGLIIEGGAVNLALGFHHYGIGFGYLAGGAFAAIRYYPKLFRESFNNKREGLRALQACYE
jgi:hypothetical protein